MRSGHASPYALAFLRLGAQLSMHSWTKTQRAPAAVLSKDAMLTAGAPDSRAAKMVLQSALARTHGGVNTASDSKPWADGQWTQHDCAKTSSTPNFG